MIKYNYIIEGNDLMGIIKAAINSVSGNLADQWLETIEPNKIDNTVLATYGILVRKNDRRNSNKKKTEDIISNGSIIHVPENTFMLLTDGGKIISATDEAGYYQVDNSRAPSIFFTSNEKTLEGYNNTNLGEINRPGGIKNSFKDSFERLKFGGTSPQKQKVVYINKMEIPNIRFGTRNPVPYTDRVLVPGRPVPCKITSFGTYSIKISDPILFYSEVLNKTGNQDFSIDNIAEQYINEFLMAYQTALASLSLDRVMVSDIPIKTMELGTYMADALDNQWLNQRGFYIQSVGIAGINYDEQTDKLLAQYGSDSILLDPNARAARMAGGIAAGLEAAGSNEGGSMMGFAGIGMGINASGGLSNVLNPKTQETTTSPMWTCSCGNQNNLNSNFCSQCGSQKPNKDTSWTCSCGNQNTGKFCSKCGNKKPENHNWVCSCGKENTGKFCSNCGLQKPEIKSKYKCSNCGFSPEDPTNPPKFCPSCGDPFNSLDKL